MLQFLISSFLLDVTCHCWLVFVTAGFVWSIRNQVPFIIIAYKIELIKFSEKTFFSTEKTHGPKGTISLLALPWSLFRQTHEVYNGQDYGSQRCLRPSPLDALPCMAKNSTKGTQMTDLEIGRLLSIFKAGSVELRQSLKAEFL